MTPKHMYKEDKTSLVSTVGVPSAFATAPATSGTTPCRMASMRAPSTSTVTTSGTSSLITASICCVDTAGHK